MSAPLRLVLARPDFPNKRAASPYSHTRELLECGHEIILSEGSSFAARRRCRKCAMGKPQDFSPEAMEAHDDGLHETAKHSMCPRCSQQREGRSAI